MGRNRIKSIIIYSINYNL